MWQTTPTHRRNARGFSIIELLVSISIIALLIGISYPFLNALNRGSRIEAGLNIVGMSADVARQWVQVKSWANDGSTTDPIDESYSGTAALYCPTGEVRILFNDRNAQAGNGDYLEDDSPIKREGYTDIPEVDYIRIPDGVGVAGIYKDPTTGNVEFIAPPFAIAFNELGQISYGDGSGQIYYDGNGSGRYGVAVGRDNSYNPSEWGNDRDANGDFTADLSLTLPFEAIECVSGVVVFSQIDFSEEGFTFDGGGSKTLASVEGQWLNENGRTLFFSPHTGTALRDEQQD